MTDRLQAELAEAKAEVQRLRERVYVGTPTVHKDLSLISLIPKWSGAETGIPLEEFLSVIESSARIGLWEDGDKLQIAALRLTDVARQFYNGCLELHSAGATWQKFKDEFRRRFRDTHTDQYHFMKLHTARQGRNETPQEFADRCRALSQKIVCKVDDPAAQRIHNENADRMLLASFVAGLAGQAGRQTRYSNPQSLDQALKIALTVQEAEKQEKFSESFYASFNDSLRLHSPGRTRRDSHEPRGSAEARRANNRTQTQRNMTSRSRNRPKTSANRNDETKAALRCYECEGFGHFARECPTRLNREASSTDSPGKGNPRERTRRSQPPDHPSQRMNRECRKKTPNPGNE